MSSDNYFRRFGLVPDWLKFENWIDSLKIGYIV